MVDEYQDTNHVQYMITKLLAAVNQNICVVGDDAQSIYAFRGANIQNILNYERDYPEVATFKLEQNYRSTQNIVNAASSLIKHNKNQLKKEVWTSNEEGPKIKVSRSPSDSDEGKRLAQLIFEDKHQLHLPNKAFAVLYRTNAQSRSIEEALRRQNLEYRIYGGISFYQRKEVKDMLAYLRLVVNPQDEEALKRIINYPVRGIGTTTITRLVYLANEHQCSIWDIIRNIEKYPDIGASASKVAQFGILIDSFRTKDPNKNAYDIAVDVAKRAGLLKTLFEDKSPEGVSKYEHLTEFLNSVQEFTEDDENESEKTLPFFLENVALYTDEDRNNDPNRDCISLMSIHASKGLEFPVVHIVGLEENLFPSQMALMNRNEIEEERRLFYVAITRAEQKLYLSFATSRFKHGNLLHCEPSRFLQEIDPKYLDMNTQSMSKSPETSRYHRESVVSSKEPVTKTKIFTTPKAQIPLPPEDPNFIPGDIAALQVGNRVQHQRFGTGTVVEIEGNGDSRKAKVNFDQIGIKTLVLKFAKMRIL
jgi:DNA helicase-2/ATP-dependent DNA helicase PcrA